MITLINGLDYIKSNNILFIFLLFLKNSSGIDICIFYFLRLFTAGIAYSRIE